MMKFLRLPVISVRMKLLLATGLAAALMGAVGFVGLMENRRLNASFVEVTRFTTPRVLALLQMKAAAYQVETVVAGFQAEGALAAQKKFALLAAMDQMRRWREQYETAIQKKEDFALAEQMGALQKQIINSASLLLDLKARGAPAQEAEAKSRELESAHQKLKSLIGEELDQETDECERLIQRTDTAFARLVNRMNGITLGVVGLVLVIGFVLSRAITVPLLGLQKAAARLGAGELETRIEITSSDEIGALGTSFNNMAQEIAGRTEQLAGERERLNVTLQSMGDGVIATDSQGAITLINGVAAALTGWSGDEAVGQPVEEVFHIIHELTRERCESPVAKVLSTGEIVELANHTVLVAKDGTERILADSAAPIRGADRRLLGTVLIFRDVTEQARKEQTIRDLGQEALRKGKILVSLLEDFQSAQAQISRQKVALEAANQQLQMLSRLKDEFVATVSHELRTPLTVIREGISQVLDGICGEPTEPQKTTLSMAQRNIDRLGHIIENLLDIAKAEAGQLKLKRELVDLVPVVQELECNFASKVQGKGLALKTRFSRDRIELYGDEEKLTQVFTNLLGNALKFTDKGSIEISITDQEKAVVCAVSDTGNGISPEDLPRVFSKFQQFGRTYGPGEKGTGLGLVISKGIVERHGGTMEVQSVFGKGTTFTFTLPKRTTQELVKHIIAHGLREAIPGGTAVSFLVFEIKDFHKIQERLGVDAAAPLMRGLERIVGASLRRQADVVLNAVKAVFAMLPGTEKDKALGVAGRVQELFHEHLLKGKLDTEIEIEVVCRAAGFPEDGNTEEELLRKIGWIVDGRNRILVIDDEPSFDGLVADYLGASGYEVIQATSGQEGLERAQKERPDLILLDLMMPDMDGLQVLRHLRERPETKDLFVVVMSGKQWSPEAEKELGEQVVGCLLKPFALGTLLKQIEKTLVRHEK